MLNMWRKSSCSSAHGNCVEVAESPGILDVRDSKNPTGPVLHIAAPAWQAFTNRVKEDWFS